MNNATLAYPTDTSAPSIETIFIEGVQFDICEVCEGAYDMIAKGKTAKPRDRFMVAVEGNTIGYVIGYESTARVYADTPEALPRPWSNFCTTRGEAREVIMSFEASLAKWRKQAAQVAKWVAKGQSGRFMADKQIIKLSAQTEAFKSYWGIQPFK